MVGAVCLPLKKREEKARWKLLPRREVSIQELKMCLSPFIGKLPAESIEGGVVCRYPRRPPGCSAEQKAGPVCWGDSGLVVADQRACCAQPLPFTSRCVLLKSLETSSARRGLEPMVWPEAVGGSRLCRSHHSSGCIDCRFGVFFLFL